MGGSDGTSEDTKDTTMLVHIEETMRDVRTLPILTKLQPVAARNIHGHDIGFP